MRVTQPEIAGVRRAAEGPRTDQRGKGSDRHRWEVGAVTWSDCVRTEGALYDWSKVGISTPSKQSFRELQLRLRLNALSTEGL